MNEPVQPSQTDAHAFPAPLRTFEGDLICVAINAHLAALEGLLSLLERLPYPVNPEIRHIAHEPRVEVTFPAYTGWLVHIQEALKDGGFAAGEVRVLSAYPF